MELENIVLKLVGPIEPVGETNTDESRFDNLKALCTLVNQLVTRIDNVNFVNKDHYEYSRKRAACYASKFLTSTLGISE